MGLLCLLSHEDSGGTGTVGHGFYEGLDKGMTTVKCDLCGVECPNGRIPIAMYSQVKGNDFCHFFDFCSKCFDRVKTNKDRIRLVIEPEFEVEKIEEHKP